MLKFSNNDHTEALIWFQKKTGRGIKGSGESERIEGSKDITLVY